MDLLKKLVILTFVSIISWFISPFTGQIYEMILNQGIEPSAFRSLIGLPLSYIFFTTLLFTAFTKREKYWWIGILLIPAFVFEFYFDSLHIYFPIILGLLGWGLGILIYKLTKALL